MWYCEGKEEGQRATCVNGAGLYFKFCPTRVFAVRVRREGRGGVEDGCWVATPLAGSGWLTRANKAKAPCQHCRLTPPLLDKGLTEAA